MWVSTSILTHSAKGDSFKTLYEYIFANSINKRVIIYILYIMFVTIVTFILFENMLPQTCNSRVAPVANY